MTRNDSRPSTQHLTIGCLIFPDQDQADFTGPFTVLSRLPNSTVRLIAKTIAPIRDMPDVTIDAAPPLDLIVVPGGRGRQEMMDDETVLFFIRNHARAGRPVFSVCTGALICGAAGILRGRRATTHWVAWDLLRYYGAIPVKSRVVVDGNYISAAGITAGIEGALTVASLLRGRKVAEQIQLAIEYAPEPPFHSGDPDTASPETVSAYYAQYGSLKDSREAEAQRIAKKLAIALDY